jgi:hypothetical protein
MVTSLFKLLKMKWVLFALVLLLTIVMLTLSACASTITETITNAQTQTTIQTQTDTLTSTTTTTLTSTATTSATPPGVSIPTGTSLPVTRPITIWKSADYTGWFLINLEVKPRIVSIGQNVNISAWLHAPGMVLTDVTAILSVNGEREYTKTFYVEGDSTDFIEFTLSPSVTGKHRINFSAILTRDLDYYVLGENDLSSTLVVIE